MPSTPAREATQALGAWAAQVRWDHIDDLVRQRLHLVLLDSLGVTLAGSRIPEHAALVEAWRPGAGPAPLMGSGRTTSVEAAAWLNATAMVRLELDEGNKHAAGHPAAHGLWAVLSLAADLGSTGADTAAALLVEYEVAARFGRATTLRPGAHPHGSWGVAGAAAGCARLLRLDAVSTAAAIDTGAGLPVAGHFSSALDGNEVRNAWMGASNVSGLAAARLAASGQARCTGTAAASLGGLLGELDPTALTDGLGTRWDITGGYFKRHASCSFTHPVADLALDLRHHVRATDVESVLVETHVLGADLARPTWDSRLSALFSTPFVAASALVHGQVGPEQSSPSGLADPAVQALAGRVTVREAADLSARLPAERAVRVTLRTHDGTEHVVEAQNPVGDADHHPLDADDVLTLIRGWVDDDAAVARVRRVAADLADADDVGPLLRELVG